MKKDIKEKVIKRLKIIEGQVRGLQNMVEKEEYCMDILYQTLAIKRSLTGVEQLMLENHLSTHVIHNMKNGKESQAVDEILGLFKMSEKK